MENKIWRKRRSKLTLKIASSFSYLTSPFSGRPALSEPLAKRLMKKPLSSEPSRYSGNAASIRQTQGPRIAEGTPQSTRRGGGCRQKERQQSKDANPVTSAKRHQHYKMINKQTTYRHVLLLVGSCSTCLPLGPLDRVQ